MYLRTIFEDPLTELWLAFVHGNLTVFHEAIKMFEGQVRCATETAAVLRNFEAKLAARCDEDFIPVLVRGLLRELVENRAIARVFSQNI